MDKREEHNTHKIALWSVIRLSLTIFVILFIGTVSLGLSPLGVQELNNAFFSLFIHDEREQRALAHSETPSVSLEVETPEKSDITLSTPSGTYSGGEPQNLPNRIVIPAIGVTGEVENPESTDISVLDTALLYGAVRYPDSGTLESSKNILIFGHSSGLKVIHNQNFRLFNGLKNLVAGDAVLVYSSTKEYRYVVESVRLANADEALVTFSNDKKLILSTCNTFGGKEERYVVEARLVSSRSL